MMSVPTWQLVVASLTYGDVQVLVVPPGTSNSEISDLAPWWMRGHEATDVTAEEHPLAGILSVAAATTGAPDPVRLQWQPRGFGEAVLSFPEIRLGECPVVRLYAAGVVLSEVQLHDTADTAPSIYFRPYGHEIDPEVHTWNILYPNGQSALIARAPLVSKIYASYAKEDYDVVKAVDSILTPLGCVDLRWDAKVLRPGDDRHSLLQEIEGADSFQLFWSTNAKYSKEVRTEWKHALSLTRDRFIKPVYWSEPMPPPPKELRRVHFSRIHVNQLIQTLVVTDSDAVFRGVSSLVVQRMEYVEKQMNITTTGQGNIVNVADMMVGVTNSVNQNLQSASAEADAKELVKELMDRVAALGSQVEPSVAERMATNVKRISEEMALANPDPAWYQLSLKGLREAAEAVGKIGKPVLETVLKLMPVLVGSS